MMKFKILNEIVYWETWICHHDIDSFPFLKDVSSEVGSDTQQMRF